tara:strand:+ start:1537 stop:2199 length:663 start_codon:yes stop_codon:yes gene_type:complete
MKAVAYYRKSTKQHQKHSIENQRRNVRKFCVDNDIELLKEWSDVESGRCDDRLGLETAIHYAIEHKTPIIVWDVSRLGRNAGSTISHLESQDYKFIIAEHGMTCSPMMLQIQAVFAAHEARTISKRIKIGLAAAKERGVQLGNPDMDAMREKSAEACRAKGNLTVERYGKLINIYRNMNLSYRQIAEIMNTSGVKTPRGKAWSHPRVFTIYKKWLELGVG